MSPKVLGTGTWCGAGGLGQGAPLCMRASFAVRLELEVCLARLLQHSAASPRPAASVSHGSDPLQGLPPIEPRPWERAGGPEGARSSPRAPGLLRVALTVQCACKMHLWAHVCLQGVHTQARACRCVHAECQGVWECTRVHAVGVCAGRAWVASCSPACVRAPQHRKQVQGFAWSCPEIPHALQCGRHKAVCTLPSVLCTPGWGGSCCWGPRHGAAQRILPAWWHLRAVTLHTQSAFHPPAAPADTPGSERDN